MEEKRIVLKRVWIFVMAMNIFFTVCGIELMVSGF